MCDACRVTNVIVILADTVRRDELGINGGATHTPNLDALGRESTRFDRAHAASFPTVPARADYFTGRYSFPATGWGPLPREASTIAELLTAAGVTTAAVVDTPFYMSTGFNLDRGFVHFYDVPGQQPLAYRRSPLIPTPRVTELDHCAPRTITTAEQCLEQLRSRAPFLLWVDTWDPHEPWDPPPWYVERYKPDYDGRVVWPPYRRAADAGLTDDDLATAVACYRGKLTMVDRWIGRLLDRVDTLNLADDTVVVFLSDHGFYLGERGGLLGKLIRHVDASGTARWRRSPLYHEIVEVPLWLRLPEREERIDPRLVSAVDVAPTILELFGVEVPASFHGRSLLGRAAVRDVALTALPLAEPGTPSRVVDDVFRVIDEWQPVTVTTDRWRLLFSRREDPVELYDLASDRGETENVAEESPDVVRQLHELMVGELRHAGTSDADLTPRQ